MSRRSFAVTIDAPNPLSAVEAVGAVAAMLRGAGMRWSRVFQVMRRARVGVRLSRDRQGSVTFHYPDGRDRTVAFAWRWWWEPKREPTQPAEEASP